MSQNSNRGKKRTRYIIYALISLLAIFMFLKSFSNSGDSDSYIDTDYSTFKEMIQKGSFSKVYFSSTYLVGQIKTPDGSEGVGFKYIAPLVDDSDLIPLLEENNVPFSYEDTVSSSAGTWYLVLVALLPIIFFIVVYSLVRKEQKGESKPSFKGMFEATPNKRIRAESDTGIRFKDIAGEDESKSELEEIVDYLKHSEKYRSMGARVPKGCLLVGPPGTGKTLLARAVAGEAGVPFFKVSGSDFVEMFVGVGASRVRELFAGAREKSPSIIFIDEIDAIGKVRGYSQMSGNDEREQTLNQLLVELDGFDSKEGVIVLAATNRAEILDPALMRAGRFDRQVYVDKPDLKGRLEILKIHTRKLKLGQSVDLEKIARISGGLAGADLANIANEAALMAVRHSHENIEHVDFENAIEKSIAGLEKKSRVLSEKEKERIAYHETGHALTAFMTKGSDPVSKISIIPRGSAALGYTMQLPREDRYLMGKSDLIATIDVLLGGRAAEDVVFGEISTGAANDISRATAIAKDMIGVYGMSERFMNVALSKSSEQYYESIGPRSYSESTQEYIDNETARIISSRYAFVKARLEEERPALSAIAEYLMENEVLEENEFARMASSLLNKSVS